MKRKCIYKPYKAYLVSADGARTPLHAQAFVIELGNGAELHLDLAAHPNHHGEVPIRAGPEQSLVEMQESGLSPSVVVRPGAADVIHVSVERRPCRVGPAAAEGKNAEPDSAMETGGS